MKKTVAFCKKYILNFNEIIKKVLKTSISYSIDKLQQ